MNEEETLTKVGLKIYTVAFMRTIKNSLHRL